MFLGGSCLFAVKLSVQSCEHIASHLFLFSHRIIFSKFSSNRAKYRGSVSISSSSYFSISQNFFYEIIIKLQHSELSILQDEEYDDDWFSMLNFCFDKFNLVQSISEKVRWLEIFLINCTVSLSIVQLVYHTGSTTINDLVPIGAVF